MSAVIILRVGELNRDYSEYNYRHDPEPQFESQKFYYFPGWLFLFILILAPLILTVMNPMLWIKIRHKIKSLWKSGIQELREWRKE